MLNLIIFIISYFLIAVSIIGYGSIFLRIFFNKNKITDFGYLGIFGLVLSIFISYSTNFFFPHNFIFNFVYLIIGLFGFILLLKKLRLKIIKNELILFLSIFSVAFISLLIFKNHDDFPYYHFVYTYNLTQFDLNVGIGQFNHGFRTPSSIFYINSLFYLPLIEYFSFNFAAVFVLAFSNIILLKKIGFDNTKYPFLLKRLDDKNYLIIFFSLLSFIFINIFFYRIGEHGTDRSAQILVMLLILEIIMSLNKRYFDSYLNLKIFTLLVFIISLKAFYILYLLLLTPVFLNNFKHMNLRDFFLKTFFNNYIILFFLIFLLMLTSYFISTGCLLYPVSVTCFENFSWSIPINQVEEMNRWYQQWSKAGAGPEFRVENPEIYIKEFNWLKNWIDEYFFNKVSDFLFGLIFLTSLTIFIFKSAGKKNIKFKEINNYFLLYFIVLILFFEWFYNHPALRYGGYNLIAIIIFLPVAIYLSCKIYNTKKLKFFFSIFAILTIFIFLGRNINRIHNEYILYSYNPFKEPFYQVNESYFREYKNLKNLITTYKNCSQNDNCLKIDVKKKYGFYIFEN
tara:strand:- start:2314 stop:4017 length:1704 start_codon:yes stop_codon:yes gene_type:complete